jgi:hypothetical protein
MADKNYKNHIKKYFKFIYTNLKEGSNLNLSNTYMQELNSDINKQIILYGGSNLNEITENIKKIIEHSKNSPIDLIGKETLYVTINGKKQLRTDVKLDEYISLLNPENHRLINKKNLEDIKIQAELLNEYLKLSIKYILDSEMNNNYLSQSVKALNIENLKELSKQVDNFNTNISKLAGITN